MYFLMLVHKIFTLYINGVLNCKCPARVKVHHRTDHEGPDREKWYTSTLSLTLALDGSVWPPFPGERPDTQHMRLDGPHSRSGQVRKI